MKKFISAMALAATSLFAQMTNAAPAEWADDPTIVYNGQFSHESCIKGEHGQTATLAYNIEVISVKKSWDQATAGKSELEKSVLQARLLETVRQALNSEWRTRIAMLTADDIANMSDAYLEAADVAFNKIPEIVAEKTGIEVMVGSDRPPTVYPGCDLK